MHVHILGICGTFMAGIAALARALGHDVTGSDGAAYPPMSTQLEQLGVTLCAGYEPEHLTPAPDLVVVGNALSRGNPAVEAMLRRGMPYTSGPQWLFEQVLGSRRVIAVAGTHGKTTTASILAWILDDAGQQPGFLIGGVPQNFNVSARLGEGECFVVEADEYDTAFFDKRSKFVHYRPHIAVLTNLEFDHADIFASIAEIKNQFHHLIRSIADNGCIIVNGEDNNLAATLAMGSWTPIEYFGIDNAPDTWSATLSSTDGRHFTVRSPDGESAAVSWEQIGRHNVTNALAAVAAASHAGVSFTQSCQSLATFRPVQRRLQCVYRGNDIRVYDDFAHHPTAIRETLTAIRAAVGQARVLAVFEPRSNTMRIGTHREQLRDAFESADQTWIYRPANLDWDLNALADGHRVQIEPSVDTIIAQIVAVVRPADHIVIMSNGDFLGLQRRLIKRLQADLGSVELGGADAIKVSH
ncbi:MAG: UDP-N-acetylmuramate:L-alanyl-gamma-D-glutamyl-meso-diaminopimelate ligase [Gammaproteobacteria bacterium]|nr:UDP-N-acetylmuramate:L-alanyl-gamma-D-glutamyl-meso-diaminopimelate ligase [Gammaproteobacteria bacterium]